MMSKLMIVDTPGLEKLAEDAEVLRAREGPTLHQSLFGLGNVIRDLSNPEVRLYFPFLLCWFDFCFSR